MAGDPGPPTGSTSDTAPALASSVSSFTRAAPCFMTLATSWTHRPKVSREAESGSGVTAKRKLHGPSLDTGFSHWNLLSRIYKVCFCRCLGCDECDSSSCLEQIEPNNSTTTSTTSTTTTPIQKCPSSEWTYYEETGKCYLQMRNKKTWDAARKDCKAKSNDLGDLASIPSSKISRLLSSFRPGLTFWVGGYEDKDNVWRWCKNDKTFRFTNWAAGYPQAIGNSSVAIYKRRWWNYNSNEKKAYICQTDGNQ